jgi:DNA mismatch repair protein MutL
MRKIKILPPELVNRIAAGEVVERPAAVVKELVENAVDAGATRLEITISEGGRNIRIADNGHGIAPGDLPNAFLNHATSKITSAQDLEAIATLGFRGEALASISAVARIVCSSRTEASEIGSKLTLIPTEAPVLVQTGCAKGTVMDIQDLFFNTPARLRFLKRPATEEAAIEEAVQALSLAYPEVAFELKMNGKSILKTSGSGNQAWILQDWCKADREGWQFIPLTFADEFKAEALKAGEEPWSYSIRGWLSPPGKVKSSKKWLYCFVNHRVVKCPILAKSLEKALESIIPPGKYPMGIIELTLSPTMVDVNVHPTKREVRYAHPNVIFNGLKHAVRTALEAHGHWVICPPETVHQHADLAPGVCFPARTHSAFGDPPASVSGNAFISGYSRQVSLPVKTFYTPLNLPPEVAVDPREDVTDPGSSTYAREITDTGPSERYRLIGQLFNTFILIETPQGLLVVDQHIASERAWFEALMRQITAQSTEYVQQLLSVQALHVSPQQEQLLRDHQDFLHQFGFQFRVEADAIYLTQVPLVLPGLNHIDVLDTLLSQLAQQPADTLSVMDDTSLQDLVATMACHSAVRAGDVLNPQQMQLVVDAWLACKLPWSCPHGRPIAHTIRTEELNQFFERPSLPVNAF